MNKEDLIKEVADQAQIKKTDASNAIDALFGAIQESLIKNQPVAMVGFGTFKVSKRKATTGRNPRTGEPLAIPEATIPAFSAGKTLKEAVNQK